MAVPDGIGSEDSSTDIVLRHEYDRANSRELHRRQTEEESTRFESELAKLRSDRLRARHELGARLGEFGFLYDAENHQIVRFIAAESPQPEPDIQLPELREPFDPSKVEVDRPAPKPHDPRLLSWIDRISWIAVPFLGAFVGYGIGMLAGMPVKASYAFTAAAIFFGTALLAVMKGGLYATMHLLAHRTTRTTSIGPVALGVAITMVLIAAEAGLAATAIRYYSQDRALRPEEVIPGWQAALIALSFSTPLLITSAIKGHYDGCERDDSDHRLNQEADRRIEEARANHEAARQAHIARDAELSRQEQLREVRQLEAKKVFEEAQEKYRSDERWQSAMGLYSAIGTITHEIAEREKLRTGYRISRGFDLSRVEREG